MLPVQPPPNTASGRAGLWNAMAALAQRILLARLLPCCDITEQPGMAVRGFLLDISRGRIPKMEMLYRLVDLLALLRYNHLELYIEGFPYAYSFPDAPGAGADAIKPEELEALDQYCAARMIELVPCQNSLGHMSAWLAESRYAHLAEMEAKVGTAAEAESDAEATAKAEADGTAGGSPFPPSTLNAADPESLELVKRMLSDLLPHFQSKQVNVCLDEPFELGTGKSRLAAGDMTPDELYLSYIRKLHDHLSKNGRKMLMWGDIAGKSAELLRELPEDILLLEWGYDADYPFERHVEAIREAGLRFLICPGTGSWTSFSGITDNMTANVRRAADAAYAYGAEGILLTDWGDFGHLQPISVSYPAMVLAAGYMWDRRGMTEEELGRRLDSLIFGAPGCGAGALMLSSGRYAQYEDYRMECRTRAAMPLIVGMIGEGVEELPGMDEMARVFARMGRAALGDKYIRAFEERNRSADSSGVIAFVDGLRRQWESVELPGDSSDDGCEPACVRAEYIAALRLVRLLTGIRGVLEGPEAAWPELLEEVEEAIGALEETWEKRSRPSGLSHSVAIIRGLVRRCVKWDT